MPAVNPLPPYTKTEEYWNTLTHVISLVIGLIGFIIIGLSIQWSGFKPLIGFFIYMFSYTMLFSCSSLYHYFKTAHQKAYWKKWDHIAIFFMIAGSYTPFILTQPIENYSIILIILLWALTLIGIILKYFFAGKWLFLSTLIYVMMGWCLIGFPEFYRNIPENSLFYLALGGIVYTLGAGIYMLKKIPFHHTLWHIMVSVAAAFHMYAVYLALLGSH